MKVLTTLFLCLCPLLSAQLKENFENAGTTEWEQNPANSWSRDQTEPISGSYSLHHSFNDTVSSFSQVSLLHDRLSYECRATWQFNIRHGYNPSSSNNWGVFFLCDRNFSFMHPDSNCNGYIIGVNFTGNDDILKIWIKKDKKIECVLNTGINWQETIGTDKSAGILIEKDETGSYSLKLDTAENGSFDLSLGAFSDTAYFDASYFGIYYRYTSSQDMKLWFDDLEITGCFTKDSYPPEIEKFWYHGYNLVTVRYNEILGHNVNLDVLSTDLSDNYISSYYIDGNYLIIRFGQHFQNNSLYTILIGGIADIYNNSSLNDTISFTFNKPLENDVVITEIMADPDPPLKLPNLEYLEIFNRCSFEINLEGWTLCVGSSCTSLPFYILDAESYLVLVKNDSSFLTRNVVDYLEVEYLPLISNTGKIISLLDTENNPIFSVEYSEKWYRDDQKKEGGWSLEMIDFNNPCGQEENWIASENEEGGTPGYINSVYAENPDFEMPRISDAVIINDTALYVRFSERVLSSMANNISTFHVDCNIGTPVSSYAEDLSEGVILTFKETFKADILYTLTIDNITDCSGNELTPSSFSFRRPSVCQPGDIVVNEVLFDPYEEGGEFIELFNRSSKTVNIKDYKLYFKDPVSLDIKSEFAITIIPYCMGAGDYIVLTRDSKNVINYYKNAAPGSFLEMDNFARLSNTGTLIEIHDSAGTVIDKMHYTDAMIYEMIRNPKGISLERISSEVLADEESNWHSASADAGYATPGYANSQRLNENYGFELTIEPDVFSPDYDNFDDFTTIRYSAESSGFVSNIYIFDRNGRLVQQLAKNNLLGTSGSFTWNGMTVTGQVAPVGIYLIYFEAFDLKGKLVKFKKTCVVAERIN